MKTNGFWDYVQYAAIGLVALAIAIWFIEGRDDKGLGWAVVMIAAYTYAQEQRINKLQDQVRRHAEELWEFELRKRGSQAYYNRDEE
ncbi:MAG: hypothetical protein V4633_13380 [Pseudomonadota bacterium]